MNKEALKKSVTLNLRCVTQSCKGGVPLTSLQADYKGLIGTAIPFTDLGYKSLEAFLQSIPDVVCLKKTKTGLSTVEGVADASTAHIASLISRQKPKVTAKKANSKKPSLLIRKYACHDSWRSAPNYSGEISKQDGKLDQEKLERSVLEVLNKLTLQKFETLLMRLKGLNINTEEKLNVVTNLIFEKAINEPNFTVPCAHLCKHLASFKVHLAAGRQVSFKKCLLTKCQIEFEQDRSDEPKHAERMEAMKEAEPDKQKEMRLEFDLEENIIRKRKLGNILFIGELCKLGMLIKPIIHECIEKLLSQENEESLECLCKLLKSIGNELDSSRTDMYFVQMQKFVDKHLTSSRVRCMLKDVMDSKKRDQEKLERSVLKVLNKLTLQKFEKLFMRLIKLNINTEEKLNVVTNLIFEKAINEPNFTVPCAHLCKHLISFKVHLAGGKQVSFKKILLSKCQIEFEQDRSDEPKHAERMEAMKEAEPNKQKEMRLEFDLEEKKIQKRKLGNILFIGELFKLGILIKPIMHECIEKLLSQENEESLECLCKLIKSIGNELDSSRMDMYFAQMQKFVDKQSISSRVQCALKDVIDLKKTSALNPPSNLKVPIPMNSGTITSASRKVVSANQNNVICGQSNTEINPFGEGPSKPVKLYSSLPTDTKTLIVPTLPSSSSQKQTEVQKIAITHISEIPSTSKEFVTVLNIEEDSILSKGQRKRRRKRAKKENSVNASEPSLNKSQRKSIRKKIRKAEKLHETTEMFMEMLKENCATPTLLNKNQLQDSGKTIGLSSNQCPLETIQAPVAPKAITKSVFSSSFQRELPYSALPKEAESNIVHKPTLKCFPRIRYSIASAKFSSLLLMNLCMFGDDSYTETLKRGILAFDGFSFCEGSEKWKEKEILLSMLSEDTLQECLKLLCIEYGSDNKKELVNKLLQFLASPGNALSNSVKKKETEEIIRKETVGNMGTSFSHFAGDVLENLEQLQECIHNQEYRTLTEIPVECASTSNTLESVPFRQLEYSNEIPPPFKVVPSKKSNQTCQVSSQESTGAESKQLQELKSVFRLNPNIKF